MVGRMGEAKGEQARGRASEAARKERARARRCEAAPKERAKGSQGALQQPESSGSKKTFIYIKYIQLHPIDTADFVLGGGPAHPSLSLLCGHIASQCSLVMGCRGSGGAGIGIDGLLWWIVVAVLVVLVEIVVMVVVALVVVALVVVVVVAVMMLVVAAVMKMVVTPPHLGERSH